MKQFESFASTRPVAGDRSFALPALVCLAFFAAIAFNTAVFNDGDTSWHLAAGRLILHQRSIPSTDAFSFTFAGKPWVAHEWFAEVIMALAFRAAGWSALALITGACVAGTLFIVALDGRKCLNPLPLVAVLLVIAMALMPFTLARPHVLTWPILALWTVILLRARDRHRAPPLAAALLMGLWANLHASFLLGLLLVCYFALEAFVYEHDRATQVKHWGLFGLLSVAAALATPHGVEGLLFPLQVGSMRSLPLIDEWQATDFRHSPAFDAALVTGAAALTVARKRVPLLRLLLIAVLTYLAIRHVRHQPLLAIVGALVLIRGFGPVQQSPRSRLAPVYPALWAGVAAICILRLSVAVPRPDSESNPLTAISHIPATLRNQPVLNSYSFGGPLILDGIRPFIDGRGDMYGDAFMFEHRRIMEGDVAAFRDAVRRWRIRWVIISPLDPLASKLVKMPGWQQIYSDQWAVIYVNDAKSAEQG